MKSTTLWRVTVTATQRDGSIKGHTVNIYGPYQPKVNMAVALKHYDPDVALDENDIEFSPVNINRIGVRELFVSIIASTFFGLVIGSLL